ncbi:MAG: hypothetical protein CMM07_06900 [Rhodopirellula sp.]|nr:hypothetical protein [Rhodopirellula sp.]
MNTGFSIGGLESAGGTLGQGFPSTYAGLDHDLKILAEILSPPIADFKVPARARYFNRVC